MECKDEPLLDENGDPMPENWALDYNGLGRDMLLSYNVYDLADSSLTRFAAYWYGEKAGRLSHKIEQFNQHHAGGDRWYKKTQTFLYNRGLAASVPAQAGPMGLLHSVQEEVWSSVQRTDCYSPGIDPCPEYAFDEQYYYDWQDRRIAKLHCAAEGFSFLGSPGAHDKCPDIVMYDYDGERVLIERKFVADDQPLTSYLHGPLGLAAQTFERTTKATSDNCSYAYVTDATGNCVGTLPLASGPLGTGQQRWSRLDAWGNLLMPPSAYPVSPL